MLPVLGQLDSFSLAAANAELRAQRGPSTSGRLLVGGCAPQGRVTKSPNFREAVGKWKRVCYAIN